MAETAIDLVIREVDPTNHDEMARFQQVYEAAERAEFPDAAVYSLEDAITLLTRPSEESICKGYGAFRGGRMVGEGFVMAGILDNLRRARLWPWVAPADRNQGVGTAVTQHLVSVCRQLGRDVLYSSATYPFDQRADHPYRRFAERLGFSLANTQLEQRLALPVPDRLLGEAADRAAPFHPGYRVHSIVGPIPADLAQGYCDVHNRLSVEAPEGDLHVEASRRTPAVLADQDAELQDQGRTRVSALALDGTSTVVALTSASVSQAGEPHVDQWATIVRRDHRGHRLGMAVKAAQIRAIQTAFPEKRFITTNNAETNEHMIAINAALGFERRALEGEFQLVLAAGHDD